MTSTLRPYWAAGVLLAALCAAGATAAPLDTGPGRLFYTPAERAQLEQARSRNVTRRATTPQDANADALRYDGVVIRSDGRATHWIDGHAQAQGAGSLKPGQLRANGKVYEPYQVTQPRPAATPPNPAPAASAAP